MQKYIKTYRIVFLLLLLCTVGFSQIPRLIAYQGILTDSKGNPRQDGKYSISFDLFSDSSGGSSLWNQSESLLVYKGMFGTLLGSKTLLNLPFNQQYWLSVSVDGTALNPRTRLASVAYCFRADTANVAVIAIKADTATFTKSINSGTLIQDQAINGNKITNNSITENQIDSNSNIKMNQLNIKKDLTIGTTQPGIHLNLYSGLNNGFRIFDNDISGIIFNSSILSHSFAIGTQSNHPCVFGTNNVFPRMLIDTNGNVGIGTSSPREKLDIISGNIEIQDGFGIGTQFYPELDWRKGISTPQRGMWIPSDSVYGSVNFLAHSWGYGPHFAFRNAYNGSAWMVINNSNVGIGTDKPTSKLQVVGLPQFNNNTDAKNAGLTIGAFYITSDGTLKAVY